MVNENVLVQSDIFQQLILKAITAFRFGLNMLVEAIFSEVIEYL